MADIFPSEMAITVTAGLDISEDTVKLCLTVIEYWLNNHPEKRITGGYRNDNGKIDHLIIEDREQVNADN